MEALRQVEVRVLDSPALADPLRLGGVGGGAGGARLRFPSLSHPEPGQQSQALRPL